MRNIWLFEHQTEFMTQKQSFFIDANNIKVQTCSALNLQPDHLHGSTKHDFQGFNFSVLHLYTRLVRGQRRRVKMKPRFMHGLTAGLTKSK